MGSTKHDIGIKTTDIKTNLLDQLYGDIEFICLDFNRLFTQYLCTSNSAIEKFSKSFHHSIKGIEITKPSTFFSYQRLSDDVAGFLVADADKERLKNMSIEITCYMKNNPMGAYKPKRGECIVGIQNGTGLRGVFLDGPTLLSRQSKVFFIDIGYIGFCDELAPLIMLEKSTACKTPFFSATICSVTEDADSEQKLSKINNFLKNIKVYRKYTCKLQNKSNDGKRCNGVLIDTYSKPNLNLNIELHAYNLKLDMMQLPSMQLDEEYPLVKFASFYTAKNCFLKAADVHFEENRFKLLDAINYCEFQDLKEPPRLGDIVAVQYRKSYFRAMIKKQTRDGNYQVELIDKGIETTVGKCSIKELPVVFKMIPRTTQKVKLANVRVAEINKLVKNFISEDHTFIAEVENTGDVTLKYVQSSSVDIVTGEASKYKNANEYINGLLLPYWRAEIIRELDFVPDQYYVQDVPLVSYQFNTELSFIVTDFLEITGQMISIVGEEDQTCEQLDEINLSERIEEYCNFFDKSYVPNEDEICLAKNKSNKKCEKWERAVCLSRSESAHGQFLVFFIDSGCFGNVWHTEIRRIITEFITYPFAHRLVEVEDFEQYDLKTLAVNKSHITGKISQFKDVDGIVCGFKVLSIIKH